MCHKWHIVNSSHFRLEVVILTHAAEKYSTLFHGGTEIIRNPSVEHGRIDIDFGPGFYTTTDFKMAKKWACSRSSSFINTYHFDSDSLNILHLEANEEWLNYVVSNRSGDASLSPFNDSLYDVIIGPTADDRIFVIADLYMDGYIGVDDAIEIINCMHYIEQVVFKKQESLIKSLKFIDGKQLYEQEKKLLQDAFRSDSLLASRKTKELMKRIHRR